MEIDASMMAALGAWLMVAITSPVLGWRWGWAGLRVGLIAIVLLQAVVAILSLSSIWSSRHVVTAALGICGGGWLAEYLGVTTGKLFGRYSYTARLAPQVGHVPIWVAIAYLGILVPSWGVADLLVAGDRGVAFVVASAVVATATDLLLDPILVSWRVWEWRSASGYFGIPWRNYVGWMGVSAVLTVVLQPGLLSPLPLLLLYSAAGLTGVLGMLIVWRLRGPALVGGSVVGVIAVSAWLRLLL